jgi:mono/diheme cytochrome c family protein
VITNGKDKMYAYADRVPRPDRWAIVAYIRALQRSQHASLADVPPGIGIPENGQ